MSQRVLSDVNAAGWQVGSAPPDASLEPPSRDDVTQEQPAALRVDGYLAIAADSLMPDGRAAKAFSVATSKQEFSLESPSVEST